LGLVNWSPLEWIRKTLSIEESQEPEPEEGSSEKQSSHLFECPVCESVYVSEDMETCSQCNEPVKLVPSGK